MPVHEAGCGADQRTHADWRRSKGNAKISADATGQAGACNRAPASQNRIRADGLHRPYHCRYLALGIAGGGGDETSCQQKRREDRRGRGEDSRLHAFSLPLVTCGIQNWRQRWCLRRPCNGRMQARRTAAGCDLAGSRLWQRLIAAPCLLHPVDQRPEQVELVERCIASRAMPHPWHEEQTGKVHDLFRATIVGSETLVVFRGC